MPNTLKIVEFNSATGRARLRQPKSSKPIFTDDELRDYLEFQQMRDMAAAELARMTAEFSRRKRAGAVSAHREYAFDESAGIVQITPGAIAV